MALPLFSQMSGQVEDEEQQELIRKAMTLAVMRHHHAFSVNHEKFAFDPSILQVVQESLNGVWDKAVLLEDKAYRNTGHDHEDLIYPELLVLYWYLVRRLRLNDRRSQEILAEKRTSEVSANHVL